MPKLEVVKTDKPLSSREQGSLRRASQARASGMISCSACGGCSSVIMETGARSSNGKVAAGTKSRICAICFTKGQIIQMS